MQRFVRIKFNRSEITEFTKLIFPNIDDDEYINIISNGHYAGHTLFISNKNKIYGVGENREHQLSNVTDNYIEKITQLPHLSVLFEQHKIKKIECGDVHTVYLTVSGQIWTCGTNEYILHLVFNPTIKIHQHQLILIKRILNSVILQLGNNIHYAYQQIISYMYLGQITITS